MNKKDLISNGFIGFNLIDFDKELFNTLDNFLDTDKYLENKLNCFKISAEMSISVHNFFDEIEEQCSDLILKNDEYENSKKMAFQDTLKENWNHNFVNCQIYSKNYSGLTNIKKYIFNNLLVEQNQSWFIGDIKHDFGNIIQNIQKKITSYFYGEFIDIKKIFPPFNYSPTELSSFSKGSLIKKHKDGRNENRVCAILIYLNRNWKKEEGGNLKLYNQIKKETIIPNFGNIVVLDFTDNNVEHEVTEIISDRNRYAVLSFLHK